MNQKVTYFKYYFNSIVPDQLYLRFGFLFGPVRLQFIFQVADARFQFVSLMQNIFQFLRGEPWPVRIVQIVHSLVSREGCVTLMHLVLKKKT